MTGIGIKNLILKRRLAFFVGYESTNIYQVWIPIKKKVIFVRDVIFDKDIV